MADRVAGRDALLFADLPAMTDPVQVVVTDPTGAVRHDVSADPVGEESRFATVVPGSALDRHGLWTATWSDGDSQHVVSFTVGPMAAGLSGWDLRLLVASREHLAIEGVVSDYTGGALVDDTLLGG